MAKSKPPIQNIWDKIFGKPPWFASIISIILLIFGIIFVAFGMRESGWVDEDIGLQIVFFILGLVIGNWLNKIK